MIPTINKSLIADLSKSDVEYHSLIVSRTSKLALKSGFIAGLIAVSIVLVLQFTGNGIYFSSLELILIFLIIIALGQNEVFSLYNQYKKKYFLYALNPGVWNTILILGISTMWLVNIQAIYIYLLYMFLAILITIFIQYKKSGVSFNLTSKSSMFGKETITASKNYWYNGVIILFMGTTFFDLNIITVFSVAGIVTVYTILLKLPELTLSIINGSVQPVYFNSIMNSLESIKKEFTRFLILSLLAFLGLGLFLYLMKGPIFEYMFNFNITGYETTLILMILMVFLASVSYMLARLSEEFMYSKYMFFISLLTVSLKVVLISVFEFELKLIIYSNIATYGSMILVGLYFLLIKKNHQYSIKSEL
ncbi:MAG: hypothetical protein JXR20_01575 [Balneola sp.]